VWFIDQVPAVPEQLSFASVSVIDRKAILEVFSGGA
jgi:hypothetical protein